MAETGAWGRQVLPPKPCVTCGKPSAMVSPTGQRIHKVCFFGNPSTGPLGEFIEGQDSKAEARALGCGTPARGQTSGRVCAATGTSPSCQLCPASPTYWNP